MRSSWIFTVALLLVFVVDFSSGCFGFGGGCGCGCCGCCRARARASKLLRLTEEHDAIVNKKPLKEMCIGLGGCGGGGGGGCGCGRGCARARASKTLRLGEGGKPLSEMSPDEQFMECCRDRLLPDSCLSHCSYRTYTADVLRAMFLRIDACPIQAASDMHFCASQSQDHRRCCAERGIGYTAAGAKCFIFCDEEPRNSTQLDMTFLPCLDKFEDMKSCFWHEANSHKALDADDGGKLYSLDRHIERARLSQPRSNQPLAPIDFSEFYPLNQQQQFAL